MMIDTPRPATVCSKRVVLLMVPLFLSLLTSCGGSSNSSPPPPASPPPAVPSPAEIRTAQLKAALHPLQTTDPAGSLADLAPLSRAAQARVVGMGEGTHGTRQFFQMKHRIFRWLVQEHGVRVFAMESDVAEGIYLDRYVQSGEGDLEAIMLARMHYWPWYTEEVRDLIQWMADYNAGRPERERLRYIGVDSATVGLQPDLLIEYLTRTAPDLLDVAEDAVGPLRVSMMGAWELYAAMSQGEYEQLREGLEELSDILLDRRAGLVDAGSEADFELHMYLLGICWIPTQPCSWSTTRRGSISPITGSGVWPTTSCAWKPSPSRASGLRFGDITCMWLQALMARASRPWAASCARRWGASIRPSVSPGPMASSWPRLRVSA